MPTILQLRRGTTAENAAYTGSVGELTVDTTLDIVKLHDGSTAGGLNTVGSLQGNIQLGKTAAGEIDTTSGNLTIDSAGGTVAIDDAVTVSGTLGVTGVATFSTHVAMGDSDILKIGAGPDLTLYHDGTNSYITNATGALKVATETSGIAITLGHSTSEVTVADNLTVTGNLTVSGTTTTVDSTTINIQNSFVFEGATDDSHETTLTTVDPTADRTISLPNVSGTLPVLAAASTTQITSTPEEINLIDGGTSAGTTAVAGGDGIVTNDNGTMRQTTVDTFDTYLAATTKTLTNKTLTSPVLNTGVSGSAILDEDAMGSNSATQLATQQSIKAYVDAKVTAEDLDVTSDSGTIDIDLDSETLTVAGGTGLSSSATGTTVTLAIDSTVATLTGTQTLTNKTLTSPVMTTPQINDSSADHQYVFAASELAADRTVTMPLLTGNDQFTMDAHASTLTNKSIDLGTNTLTGSLAEFNTALQSESFAGLAAAQTLTNKTISGSSNTLSNIANGSLTNSAITMSDGSNTTAVALGGTMTFAGTNNEIEVAESSGTLTIGLPNNVTISGNLTVSGDTTTVNTATLAVEDPLVSLATGNNSSDAVDIGIYGLYDTSGSQDLYGGLFRDANDSGKWKLFKDTQAAPTTTVNTSGTGYAVGTLVANLEATTATLGGVNILSTTNSETVTNKTINASNNTISNIVSSMFSSAVSLAIINSSGTTQKTIYGPGS